MREFFHGWRRKAGCVTLAMACALMGAWIQGAIRSCESIAGLRPCDEFYFPVGNRQNRICFQSDQMSWTAWNMNNLMVGSDWTASYWSLAMPLALLSAYLLLWKPRKRTGPDHA